MNRKLRKLPKTTPDPKKAAIWWIEWQDSTLGNRWITTREAVTERDEVTRCYSVGLLLANDKHGMLIASSAHGGEVTGVLTIPRGAILRAKRIR